MNPAWKQEGKGWALWAQGPGTAWLLVWLQPMAGKWAYDITLTFEGDERHALRTIAPGVGHTLEDAKADAEARIATLRELLGWPKGGAQ